MERFSLEGKAVLVTGGARGLGEAICRMLVREGAVVAVADIREEMAARLAEELNVNGGGRAMSVALDVRSEREIKEAMEQMITGYGRLDILINNAGTDKTISVEDLPAEDWDLVLATNLRGPFLLSKYAFPLMKKQGHGHIVNIVSTAAKRAWPNAAAYHASKWGLLGFSHALHTEARLHHIKVSAIVVGGMRTPFILDRFADVDQSTLQDPGNVAETIRFVLSQPEETVIPEIMVVPMRETSWP